MLIMCKPATKTAICFADAKHFSIGIANILTFAKARFLNIWIVSHGEAF